MNPLITKRCSPIEEAIYQDGFQAGSASRDAEVAELTKKVQFLSPSVPAIVELTVERDALQADNARLRDALEDSYMTNPCDTHSQQAAFDKAQSALFATPEQSLTEYRNKVIEAFVNEFSRHVGGDGEFWLHELQDFAMKEQP